VSALHVETTALASSIAPFPPSPQCHEGTAAVAPASSAATLIASSSASESDLFPISHDELGDVREFVDGDDDRNSKFSGILNVLGHIDRASSNKINVFRSINVRERETRRHLHVNQGRRRGTRTLGPPPCILRA
jgi:hypothetical protein